MIHLCRVKHLNTSQLRKSMVTYSVLCLCELIHVVLFTDAHMFWFFKF